MKKYVWNFVFVLPNIALDEPFEESKFIAIVPPKDRRIKILLNNNPNLTPLINEFYDQFRKRVTPSILLIRNDIPKQLKTIESLISYRNIFAINSILYGWQSSLKNPNVLYPLYSDYFKFYPIILSKNNDWMRTKSPALIGFDEPCEFCGQIDAGLNNFKLRMNIPDEQLFYPMLKIWEERYLKNHSRIWNFRVLFRSIEMAMQALSSPLINNSSFYENGTRIGLWISAFEVLIHPQDGEVNLDRVLEIIGNIHWNIPRLSYNYYSKNKMSSTKINLPQKLYCDLYNARNDFLHGNKIYSKSMYPFQNRKKYPLTYFAPILYRRVILEFMRSLNIKKVNYYTENMEYEYLSWFYDESLKIALTDKI